MRKADFQLSGVRREGAFEIATEVTKRIPGARGEVSPKTNVTSSVQRLEFHQSMYRCVVFNISLLAKNLNETAA